MNKTFNLYDFLDKYTITDEDWDKMQIDECLEIEMLLSEHDLAKLAEQAERYELYPQFLLSQSLISPRYPENLIQETLEHILEQLENEVWTTTREGRQTCERHEALDGAVHRFTFYFSDENDFLAFQLTAGQYPSDLTYLRTLMALRETFGKFQFACDESPHPSGIDRPNPFEEKEA